MSYSVSKINYYINVSSFGNNQTNRNSIDFGIYEPTSDSVVTAPSIGNVLQGPQVVFGQQTNIITPSTTGSFVTSIQTGSILQATGLPQNEESIVVKSQQEVVDALKNFALRRNTQRASVYAATAIKINGGNS